MSTKKLLIIIGSIAAVLLLVVLLFVGGITGFVFYTISNSEAAQTARNFLKNNERFKQETGDVRDFGSLVTGSVESNDAGGAATINLKAIGEKRTVNASVNLIYKVGYNWRVVSASYKNDAGKTIELLDSYGTNAAPDAGESDTEKP